MKHNMYTRLFLVLLSGLLIIGNGMPALAEDSPYQVEVGKYGMTPVYGQDLVDGQYELAVDSSSKYFKIVHGVVTGQDGALTASIEIGSHSYSYLYLGTPQEAEAASESDYIIPEEKGDSYVFTFPLSALNKPIDCAAFSKRKKKWYDRRLLFDATSLPEGALRITLPDYDAIEEGLALLAGQNGGNVGAGETSPAPDAGSADGSGQTVYGKGLDAYTVAEPVSVDMPDGEYSIEVSMTGGTGRTSISSPTLMIVKEGKAYARILMSSSHYDWMIAAGEKYENENTDGGNSAFTIPIIAMDKLVNIVADTTAMGDPVAIEYTLTFYEDTVGNKGQIPQEAAKKVLVVAIVIIIAGGILNHFAKKGRRKSSKKRRRR